MSPEAWPGGAGADAARPGVSLVPMDADQLAARLPEVIEDYAQQRARDWGIPLDRSRAEAAEQTRRLLPDGARTTGMLLLSARDGDAEVGWIWLALPGTGNHPGVDRAWVNDIQVDPDHRGRGYGRAIMLAAERELAARGVTSLGLNVFGANTVARRLYESLGFEVTSQHMAKPLDPPQA